MSLRSKLFGAIGLTLTAVLGVLVVLALAQDRAREADVRAYRDAELGLAGQVAMVVPPASLQDTLLLDREGRPDPRLHLRAIGAWRRGEDGSLRELVSAGDLRTDPAVRERAARLVARAFATGHPAEEEAQDIAAIAVLSARRRDDQSPAGGPAAVYLELAPADLAPARASRVSYFVLVGAGVVLLAVTWFIVDRVVARPLREVVRGARRIAQGDYGTPVPGTGADDEIQTVVGAFNSMMVELGAVQGRMRERVQEALLKARETQESLVIAQRLAATGRLAAGIAHEVNNPLGGMLNALHVLRTKEMPAQKREEYLDLLEDGLRRVQQTVSKILQFTPHKVAPQPVDLENVVRPVLALARHRIEKESVEVELQLSAEPAQVFGDPYELQQALLNVVLNALDAVEAAGRETPRLVIQTSVSGDEVRLLVRDNGTGMKEEDVPRAFDLFFTTKERGTGLGLAVAHKILSDHGGRIELRPRGGEGMDVEFLLPRFRT